MSNSNIQCREKPPPRMDTTDSDALDGAAMRRLREGKDSALNELMERHAERVFHYLYRLLGNEQDAHDLAQETFSRVYQYRDRFRSGSKFSTWLYTIASNLARNHIRWKARHPTTSLDADGESASESLGEMLPASGPLPHEQMEASERAQAVRAAINQLPLDFREALVLCEWQDMPVAEAAAALHTTPKAIESRLYRARKLLRETLKKWL